MRWGLSLLIVSFLGFGTGLGAASADVCPAWGEWLTPEQRDEIDLRLKRFYTRPLLADAMNDASPKFDTSGRRLAPRTFLRSGPQDLSMPWRFVRTAGGKLTEAFRQSQCRVRERFFPGFRCEEQPTWAELTANDRVVNLVRTWMLPNEVVFSLDRLPIQGQTSLPLWSDDYWRWRFGGLAYRYATRTQFPNYKAALAAYSQPDAWAALLKTSPLEKISEVIVRWSPAEKYDLSVGDTAFGLTLEQRSEGANQLTPSGDVEDWMGICQGWTAAALRVPRPTKPVTLVGAAGVKVPWFPEDVRAVTSLAWAFGGVDKNHIGGRCNTKKPANFPNGRISDPRCFDTNPATFQLALGNLIGVKHLAFAMDKAFDYEVWNQPVANYQLTYFNPLHPEQKNSDWKKVAVPYDATFKARDRFQHPLTRGRRVGRDRYDDHRIEKIVGAILTVGYYDELSPTPPWGPQPPPDPIEHETYTYDLELATVNGSLIPTGGEWFQNAHPDFLWMPRQDSYPNHEQDDRAPELPGTTAPPPALTEAALRASEDGYPLCPVLKKLLGASAGVKNYPCGD